MTMTAYDIAEQRALKRAREWISSFRRDGFVDKQKAEDAIYRRFKHLGFKNPRSVLWCLSPDDFEKKIKEARKKNPKTENWNRLGDRLVGRVLDQLRGQRFDQLLDRLWCHPMGPLTSQIWGRLVDQLWYATYYDCLWHALDEEKQREIKNFFRYVLESRSNGALVYTEVNSTVFVLQSPKHSLDEQRRLHATDGPAVEWADGTKWYYYQGVKVSEKVIMAPSTLTAEEVLGQSNIELRRLIIERIGGAEGLFKLLGAKLELIDETPKGKLFRVPFSHSLIPYHLLMVYDPAKNGEPAFLWSQHAIHDVQTATPASFGKTPEEYRVIAET